MLDGAMGGSSRREGKVHRGPAVRVPGPPRGRRAHRPRLESLEGRELMAASIASIPTLNVRAFAGFQQVINGSAANSPQTFSVTSSNPDIKATIAQGQFVTLNISHTAANSSDISFNGAITFQLFGDLTPNTANEIASFVQSGFYNNKNFHRVATGFPTATDYIVQGGSVSGNGSGNSGLPGTPFANEPNQQLVFNGTQQVAMANAGLNTNDTQFFFTTASPSALDFGYTIFAQIVSAVDFNNASANLLTEMTKVALTPNTTTPVSQITITGSSLSTTNPNGVIHIDTTNALPGETSTITVNASNPSTNTTATQSFTVKVTANTETAPIAFPPVAGAINTSAIPGIPVQVQLNGQSGNPNSNQTLTYTLTSQPAHGTVSNFNPSTGSLTYTPTAGFTGLDTFQYTVTSSGSPDPNGLGSNVPIAQYRTATPAGPPLTSQPKTVTIDVTPFPQFTGAVREVIGPVDNVLIVSPLPRTDHGINTIQVQEATDQAGNSRLQVVVNGVTDPVQPLASDIQRIVVFGSKASDHITVNPNVDPTILVTLDGGHGGKNNRVQAGAGATREHGWFGQNVLIGGSGANELVGRTGHVKFVPTSTTDEIFAGHPNRAIHKRPSAPSGTFFAFVNGRLIPSTPAGTGSHTGTRSRKTTTAAKKHG